MRFRRLFNAALAVVAASVLAVVAVPRPAAADPPVYLQLLWIRCQNETGDFGADEIRVDIDNVSAGTFSNFHVRQTRYFLPPVARREFVGDTQTVAVWEMDGPWSADDFQGSFVVDRSLLNTGEHEGYAFLDGEWIVRYQVVN